MITTPAQRVAAEVRGELARQRKTQADLAAALGLSQQAVSRRVSGSLAFDIDELHRVAEWLGVPLARLLGDTAGAA